jgi:iron-sulfur cluster repair protein YtfE (RIC family)
LNIEGEFMAVKAASTAAERRAALKRLAEILTAHSIAEEAVLYPAMAISDQKSHSGEAYMEQSAAKVQIAALDEMDPMSQDFLDKLEHVRGAVAHHVYREEGTWFPNLVADSTVVQSKLASRYQEEFTRYMHSAAKP